jgi:hypothetical protein
MVNDSKRPDRRRQLIAIRGYPLWLVAVTAVVLLVLPWVIALALVGHHHLDFGAVSILAAVSIPLSGLWLTWVTIAKGGGTETPVSEPLVRITAGQFVYQQPDVMGKPVSLGSRPAFLAGRDDLLTDLDTRLSAGDSRRPRIVALCGLGGVGKSSVAVEYAYRHLDEVGVAWRFAAEDRAVLAAEFGKLAAQLGVRDVLDQRDPVMSVHGMLAAFAAEWLLVFDNAPDGESVERFLPPVGHGRLLITSQNPNWPPGQALEVPVLNLDAAADFLVHRTGDTDRQSAIALADELGELPLALEQAAAYMQTTESKLADYLALFRQRRQDLLARGQPTGSGETVAATLALAFGQLDRSDTALLRLLACCAPEAIPVRLLLLPRRRLAKRIHWGVARLLVPLLKDTMITDHAIAALRQYSLISPATGGSFSVHRLVQAVTLDQMTKRRASQWRQATAALIETAIPEDPAQPDNWSDFAALLPHAQAVLTADSHGLQRIANYLGYRGNYVAAREFSRRIFDEQEKILGSTRRDTLKTRADLAYWTGQAGDAAGARDQYAVLLNVIEPALGPEDPDTLTARANLARWTGEAGDEAGARDQYAILLPMREGVSGPEHRSTLIARANLARWIGDAGDAAGARDQCAALLPIMERVLGPENPDTRAVRGALARWTGEAGDAAEARDQYAALVPMMEQILGQEHPETLTARDQLARWTGDAGNATRARDQLTALIPVMERVLGPEHPTTLVSGVSLAGYTGAAGDAAGARDQLAALTPAMERVFGPQHPKTLAARANLAGTTGTAGDAAEARDMYAALLPMMERILGPEHPNTLAARANLAGTTGTAGDAAEARDMYAALLPIRERVFGSEHRSTLIDRLNFARWTGAAGDAAKARDQLGLLLPVMQRVLGPEHPLTLGARSSLADWTGEAGDAAGARDQYGSFLPVMERILGSEHPATATVRSSLIRWTGQAANGPGPA